MQRVSERRGCGARGKTLVLINTLCLSIPWKKRRQSHDDVSIVLFCKTQVCGRAGLVIYTDDFLHQLQHGRDFLLFQLSGRQRQSDQSILVVLRPPIFEQLWLVMFIDAAALRDTRIGTVGTHSNPSLADPSPTGPSTLQEPRPSPSRPSSQGKPR